MFPEYCFDCMNRQQIPMNNMGYMQPMMNGTYQQPIQGMYPMQQNTQIPMDTNPIQMHSGAGGQTMQQFPGMQPGVGGQTMQQFPGMQPGMDGQGMQQFPGMQPGMGGQGMQQFPIMQQMGAEAGGPDFAMEQGTPVETNINYTQAYLRTKIGQRVKIEFLIGTNMLIDREGTLLEVGVSYVVIREVETDDDLLCDIYSIKFVRFYY